MNCGSPNLALCQTQFNLNINITQISVKKSMISLPKSCSVAVLTPILLSTTYLADDHYIPKCLIFILMIYTSREGNNQINGFDYFYIIIISCFKRRFQQTTIFNDSNHPFLNRPFYESVHSFKFFLPRLLF